MTVHYLIIEIIRLFIEQCRFLKQLSKYIQPINYIEGFNFGNGLVRNFDKDRVRFDNTNRGRVVFLTACHGSRNRDTCFIHIVNFHYKALNPSTGRECFCVFCGYS